MRWKRGLLLLAAPVFLILGAIGYGFVNQPVIADVVVGESPASDPVAGPKEVDEVKVPAHVALPEEVRGIYWTAATPRVSRADDLLAYMAETGLNAVVIDVKMDNGEVAWPPEEMMPRIAELGFYRIARVAVMRDSAFALAHPSAALYSAGGGLWRDKTGAAWLDPAAPEVVENAIAIGREAYARGFDEVQFDYIRFASDGALSSIRYPVYDFTETKSEVMAKFFETAGGAMRADGIPVSFDLFGMTFETSDDFGIGQRLVDAFPNADFVSPMVYPSHYASGFQGYANPALYPYEVVTHSLTFGLGILSSNFGLPDTEITPKFRPWIQDFDIGAVYTAERIEAQIKAARDAGASGWMLWNARNVYEPAKYVEQVGQE